MSDPGPRSSPGARPWPRVSRLRIAGPVVLIVAALVAAGISATVSEHNGPSTSTTPGTGEATPVPSPAVPLTYAAALKVGKAADYHWGSECDHKTGRLKIPSVFAPPCVPVPAAAAPNGGSTAGGVTGTAVNLVYYKLSRAG